MGLTETDILENSKLLYNSHIVTEHLNRCTQNEAPVNNSNISSDISSVMVESIFYWKKTLPTHDIPEWLSLECRSICH